MGGGKALKVPAKVSGFVAALLLACMCSLMPVRSEASTVYACEYDGFGGCLGGVAYQTNSAVLSLVETAVLACAGVDDPQVGPFGYDYCTANGGAESWVAVSELTDNDFPLTLDAPWTYYPRSHYALGTGSGGSGGGGGGGGAGSTFDPADLDPEQIGAAFAAGWVLVASALMVGIGFQMVLGFFRKA